MCAPCCMVRRCPAKWWQRPAKTIEEARAMEAKTADYEKKWQDDTKAEGDEAFHVKRAASAAAV